METKTLWTCYFGISCFNQGKIFYAWMEEEANKDEEFEITVNADVDPDMPIEPEDVKEICGHVIN